MNSRRLTFIHSAVLGLALGVGALAIWTLPGCGGQDVTIGPTMPLALAKK